MITLNPGELDTPTLTNYLQGTVGPRPIALASTINEWGQVNLSPFSFFNLFSTNPPTLIFSPSRRVRDNTTKHTLANCEQTKEVVINVVTYNMVEQTSLSSTEYAEGVDEFVKAGFTALPAELVKPPRVKESPVQFECKVTQIIALGTEGGAGNLVVCEVVRMHLNPAILDENGKPSPHKLDLVARMGGNWYARANGDALFEVEKPLSTKGIGVDQIPPRIRKSVILNGNDLGKLGNVERMPSQQEVEEFSAHWRIQEILNSSTDGLEAREQLHLYAKELLDKGKVMKAWKALLCDKINQS